MNFMRELESGIRKNSFEDNDSSLDDFLYMDGNLPSKKNKRILIYKWNNETNSNERTWINRENL